MEIWKDIKGYEGLYQISNKGNVFSLRRNKVMSPLKRSHGYLGVQLHSENGKRTHSIHRLVAEAFIPNPNDYAEVNHKDEDKENNCVDNLEWCDRKYNVRYGTCRERRAKKQVNGKCSKPIAQYTTDGMLVAIFPSLAEVNRQLGFAQGNICRCAKGDKKYSHAYGYQWKYVAI